jgi:hypothetical protein
MVNLKEYVDFITSLVEMDEVKDGKFILPKHMGFQLERQNHRQLHKEVLLTKKIPVIETNLEELFEVDVLGITLKFNHEGFEN